MNTLKTIITIAIVLFALTSTQQTQAQTKEETLEWLRTNGKEFVNVTDRDSEIVNGSTFNNRRVHYISDIDEDGLIYRMDAYLNGEKKDEYSEYYHIPFKAFLYEDVETLSNVKAGMENNVYGFYIRFYKENSQTPTGFWLYYDINKEKDAKRTIKAIMHMAKLSGAKENKQIF